MMTFKPNTQEAFVWIYLPDETQPVVAGKIVEINKRYYFTYASSYRARHNAIALSPFELPLRAGTFEPAGLSIMPSCLQDVCPDAWGRRLLTKEYPDRQLNELELVLLSGSDRIGALDFQISPNNYSARAESQLSLDKLSDFIRAAESNNILAKQFIPIIMHGTSIGGARPKCLILLDGKQYIAKFSLSTDYYPIVRSEFLAMRLAKLAGLDVPMVRLEKTLDRDVLCVERFDRIEMTGGITRKHMLSGLSLLGLDEMEARYASYLGLAEVIRHHFDSPQKTLNELFARIVFNVVVGNTDDHARNHSAFWNGKQLSLTPAYDICPQMRVGGEASQAMQIGGEAGNAATLKNVLSVHKHFHLNYKQAKDIIEAQVTCVKEHWDSVCDEAKISSIERRQLMGRVILSDYPRQAVDRA